MPGASQAGAWPTKHSLLMPNYEPKSPSRRAGDRSDEKIVIVRGALSVVAIEGTHLSLFDPPYRDVLCARFFEILEAAWSAVTLIA